MRRIALLLTGVLLATAGANVVRPAPNVTWDAPAGANSLRSMRGQPVILLVAQSGRTRAFRKQLRNLEELYEQFASRKAVFVAALQQDTEVNSNIPFAHARDPAKVFSDYGVGGAFNIIIIGKDGNVDLQTSDVIPAERVRDVINNSFVVQSAARKAQ